MINKGIVKVDEIENKLYLISFMDDQRKVLRSIEITKEKLLEDEDNGEYFYRLLKWNSDRMYVCDFEIESESLLKEVMERIVTYEIYVEDFYNNDVVILTDEFQIHGLDSDMGEDFAVVQNERKAPMTMFDFENK